MDNLNKYIHADKNILLNQIITDNSSYFIKEIIPDGNIDIYNKALIRDNNGTIRWLDIDACLNVIVNNKLRDTNIYYTDGRIGVNRYPLFNYGVDIATQKNKVITALHIGDGSFGFSMGNGTVDGFIPEIIGVGSTEYDAGLYFVGIAGNDNDSNIPLVIIDGRDAYNNNLLNRPIFGVTSANYNNYALLVDSSQNLTVNGNILANDVLINTISLIKIIQLLQEQINDLKTKIT
jgi:hypothetical protein